MHQIPSSLFRPATGIEVKNVSNQLLPGHLGAGVPADATLHFCAAKMQQIPSSLFRSAANQVSGDFIRLARARIDTRAVGRASTGTDFDLVDLLAVAGNMAKEYPEESAAVQRAVEDMVLYTVSNAPQCDGMSLYYPFYNEAYYKKDWKDTYRELSLFPDYLQYLERYETIWLGTDMQRYFSNALTLEVGAAPSTYTLQLSDEQAAVFADANPSPACGTRWTV